MEEKDEKTTKTGKIAHVGGFRTPGSRYIDGDRLLD